jgi:hypothetical protein
LADFIFGVQLIDFALVMGFAMWVFGSLGLDMRVWRVFEGLEL